MKPAPVRARQKKGVATKKDTLNVYQLGINDICLHYISSFSLPIIRNIFEFIPIRHNHQTLLRIKEFFHGVVENSGADIRDSEQPV